MLASPPCRLSFPASCSPCPILASASRPRTCRTFSSASIAPIAPARGHSVAAAWDSRSRNTSCRPTAARSTCSPRAPIVAPPSRCACPSWCPSRTSIASHCPIVQRTPVTVPVILALLLSLFMIGAAPTTPAPAGIAVDADGNVYVSDYAFDRVVKFAPDGMVVAQWGSSGSSPGQFNAPFGLADRRFEHAVRRRPAQQSYSALCVRRHAISAPGASPAPHVASSAPLSAWRSQAVGCTLPTSATTAFRSLAPTARRSASSAAVAAAMVSFCDPPGVAVDNDGGVYITDHFNDRVQKFSAEGRFEAQVGSASPRAAHRRSRR